MKITAIHTTPGERTLPSPAVGGLGPIHTIGLVATRIETDAGLVGEHMLITLHGRHVRVLDEMVQSLTPLVVGRDPRHSTAIWADGWRQNNFVGHKGVAVMGLSAIDSALWDIRGKAAGLNIAALIGQARVAVPNLCQRRPVAGLLHRCVAGRGEQLRDGRVPRRENAPGLRPIACH